MEISLIAGQTNEIDFAPSTEYAEILQNIRTILATPVFSVEHVICIASIAIVRRLCTR